MTTIIETLKGEFHLSEKVLTRTIDLIDAGNTIPFIARYRKEETGNMNDTVLRELNDRLGYLRRLDARKADVAEAIKAQDKWTPALEKALSRAETMQEVEDLYLPFKKKRRTRAMKAKEAGLEPLAEALKAGESDNRLLALAEGYINADKGVASAEQAVQGAQDIVAEAISEQAVFRKNIREVLEKRSVISTEVKPEFADQKTAYLDYYHHTEPIAHIANHRILAINRGEREKVLSVKIDAFEAQTIRYLMKKTAPGPEDDAHHYFAQAVADSYKRLIFPAISREIRSSCSERAEKSAIASFGTNLKKLLLGRPLKGKTVMGFDPGFKNGCKIAVLDPTGKLLTTSRIFLPYSKKRNPEAARTMTQLINNLRIDVIAIGNGTASRESEQFIAALISREGLPVQYTIVSEAGASMYSASPLAAEEYPDVDVSLRGAISIAGRLQDPMSELVKIEPEHIGVGQYQHDVDQKALREALAGVVEDAVNHVGVDVNRASAVLLKYVSGITEKTARAIVACRDQNGPFFNRRSLLKVKGLGAKTYEQCAGFLRIDSGSEPLDNTAVHPESYPAAKAVLKAAGLSENDLRCQTPEELRAALDDLDLDQIAAAYHVGKWTLTDIVDELKRPGRDPRDSAPPIILKREVLSIEDLKPDMQLTGTVRNVVDFGAFVDIGVHHDGLVHISEIADRYIKDPSEVLSVGDIVTVRVLDVDLDRNRIALSMRL